ncbi:hypothetical protein [uncultured Gilliamella sp.]|uniref:hypothetical protein n=1 Tax=uncultured Gilliamella sp. TaxID=1193505 RepID=UPI0025F2021B|nr:hypothetical protein [uncultured Gilliamella sp.]
MIKALLLIFLLFTQFVFATERRGDILVDANILKKQNPEKIILDGEVYADLNNDNLIDTIKYSYSVSPPPTACVSEDCVKKNELSSNPILTFDIFLNGSDTEISGNYMCQYIGILKTTHNEMKDIFCGPSYILEWSGSDYVLKN